MDEARRLADRVLARCRELGFAVAGITEARPVDRAAAFWTWLDADKHGEMTYLEQHTAQRIDPGKMMPGARSIICVGDRYHIEPGEGTPVTDGIGAADGPRGRIARYARGDDYHVVIKKRLHLLCDDLAREHPGAQFRTCVDTAPILERDHAERAGLGAVGKHTLLIERSVGSYLLLGEIITSLTLAPSEPAPPDPCGTCTRCIDACPTDAITPWSVDATRCISYLTIEHRSAIDDRHFRAIDDWIFGCDVCQEVCPHNQANESARGQIVHEAYRPRHTGFDLLEVLGWTEDDRRAAFIKSAMKRAKLDMMKRNALIAAGNALEKRDSPELRRRIAEIAADETEPEMVRATARAVARAAC